jgi:sec-independent protein translocase protein TatA
LLFFGFKKIPELARNFGKASVEYKKARIEDDRDKKARIEDDREIRRLKDDAPVNPDRNKLEQIADSLGIDYVRMTDRDKKRY